ncbi:MAG: L-rhamnose isomerase [Candidatus Dormibacteraceae bacterium]
MTELDPEALILKLGQLRVETPSWGYGDSGTRFKVFGWPGAARDIHEKLEDAAQVNRLTGVCPSVAIHIPWDRVDDWDALRQEAASLGLQIGAINPNLFQDDTYKLGSVCNPDPAIRRLAVDHLLECIQIGLAVGSDVLSVWLADGTNYAGQDEFRARKHRLAESLRETYSAMPDSMRLLVEYKLFEPAFYHTDLPDWGTAYALTLKLGARAQVLVDTGHHAHGTNIEQIVAFLLDEGRLGGFHFNGRKYADDDLIVGSTNPFELFLIFNELMAAGHDARDVTYMIDQAHNIEPKVEAMVQSVVNVQIAHAKALLVDRDKLAEARISGDVLGAHRILLDAFESDVRPFVAEFRRRCGLEINPVAALRRSGYAEKMARDRVQPPAQPSIP